MKFRTTINCGGCVATVTPVLNGINEIASWHVNTESPDKILTVETKSSLEPQKVIDSLKTVGFKATPVD